MVDGGGWLETVLGLLGTAIGGLFWRQWQMQKTKADVDMVAAALKADRNTVSALSARVDRRIDREEGNEIWRHIEQNRENITRQAVTVSAIEEANRGTRESVQRIERMVEQLLHERRDGR